MNPDTNQSPTPTTPASLPVVPPQPQPQAAPSAAVPPQPQADVTPPTDLTQAVSMQARSLVTQYQHDPYRLSGALGQLKAQYLADQFHITPKPADE